MIGAGAVEEAGAPAALAQRMLETAVAAARAAGEAQMRLFRRDPLVRDVRDHDLTLEVDQECERVMVRVIRAAFPGHGIISEEGGTVPGTEPWLWVLDPLDGTVNYYHGIPFFCSCASCHGRPAPAGAAGGLSAALGTVAAAVVAPALGETFAAARGRGASVDGRPLACAPVADLGKAVVGVSLGSAPRDTEAMARLCRALGSRARKLRSFGATGYDLAQVAAGRLGGLAQRRVNLWDVAAGALVAEEAGAVVEGRPLAGGRWDLVAGARGAQGEIAALASEAWTPSA